ncbi:PiggyBac transposable element-derived protein 4 [Plakobranchus ocellatus]|uniref:PiggyBac transposable element-derived protein 4 n=1 Tax=Plakobranchus ocellatus TaxID=259542 RepID=A0AAV4DS75_9GAST|nr:PiggyBac transposable element-derived protein 4 [Plakobranchus ocellatus]
MASNSQFNLSREAVIREISMDSDSDDGDFLSDDDPDYDQSGSETESDQTPDGSGSDTESSSRSRSRSTHQAAGDGGRGMSVRSNNADWNKDDVRPNVPAFTATKGVQVPIPQGSKALEYFNLFADDDFFNLLVTETNRYAAQVKDSGVTNYYLTDWKPVTHREIHVYLALMILSGIVNKPQQRLYWSKRPCLYTPIFGQSMPRRSIPLFEELETKGTSACGTLRSNRKGIPYDLRSKKLKKGESDFRRKGDLMCMKYHDKKEVYLLSTAHSPRNINTGKINRHTQEPIVKPEVVAAYNNYMKGVDQFDQNLMYYNFNKKTVKWWKRAATHLFHMMKVQAYIIYRENEHQPSSQLDFTLDIIDEILEETALLNPLPPAGGGQRLTGRDMHYLTPVPPTEKRLNPTKNCKVCTIPSNDKRPGAKRYIHRRESRYQCLECGGIPLCVHPCHKLYHTVQDFRRSILRQLNLNNTVD